MQAVLNATDRFLRAPRLAAGIPLVVVDVSARVQQDADYACTLSDVLADERLHGAIPRGALVCLRTGWAEGCIPYESLPRRDEA